MKVIQAQISNDMTKISYIDIDNTLEAKQTLVGGYIEPVEISYFHKDGKSYSVDLVCNEEGKILNLHPSCVLFNSKQLYDIIAGDCFIALADITTGEYVSLPEWLYNIIDDYLTNCNYTSFYGKYRLLDINSDDLDYLVNKYVKEHTKK